MTWFGRDPIWLIKTTSRANSLKYKKEQTWSSKARATRISGHLISLGSIAPAVMTSHWSVWDRKKAHRPKQSNVNGILLFSRTPKDQSFVHRRKVVGRWRMWMRHRLARQTSLGRAAFRSFVITPTPRWSEAWQREATARRQSRSHWRMTHSRIWERGRPALRSRKREIHRTSRTAKTPSCPHSWIKPSWWDSRGRRVRRRRYQGTRCRFLDSV